MAISRRKFLADVGVTGAAFTIVPRHVLGRGLTPPSDRLNIAGVGVGGMGRINLLNLGVDNNIVALCDVDWDFAGRAWDALPADLKREEDRLAKVTAADARRNSETRIASLKKLIAEDMPKVTRHRDFRRMLTDQRDIDARRRRHTRSPARRGRHGRHGSGQTRLRAEAVVLVGARGAAARPKGAPHRIASELRWNWAGVQARLSNAMGLYSVPDTLAWDLFLGPAPLVEYHPVYRPFNWRGWVDWGVGAIGDMGAHLLDHAYWALDLGYPTSVETVSTTFNKASYPLATTTYYEFPARGAMPPVKLVWYDGGLLPPRPAALGDEPLKAEGGAILVGSKGTLMYDTYGQSSRLLPKTLEETPFQTRSVCRASRPATR